MSDRIEYRGFTKFYPTPVNKLLTTVNILPVSSRDKGLHNIPVSLEALWDTGAMKTCMRPGLRDRLNLRMFRIGTAATMAGIGGTVKADFTTVSLFLTYNLGIEFCPMYVLDFPGNADIIIGMDIIRMGDFAVCNAEGKTSFSFAMPPFPDRINFSEKADALNSLNKVQPK
jgi:hypothetical protein